MKNLRSKRAKINKSIHIYNLQTFFLAFASTQTRSLSARTDIDVGLEEPRTAVSSTLRILSPVLPWLSHHLSKRHFS